MRLRPVLITVAATVIAMFPLAAHGRPLWEPLCYAQIGGRTFATFVTLLLVPVLYATFVLDLKLVKWASVGYDPVSEGTGCFGCGGGRQSGRQLDKNIGARDRAPQSHSTLRCPMDDPALWHRLQFAFTVTYHYLFPQLTMGLAWFLVYWHWRALRTGDQPCRDAARFWARIFGLTFAVGVVTGIPMEFQFGTNWGAFSKYAGGVIGQTLAMEGMFAFFLESAFIGALIYGEGRLSPRLHFAAAVGVAAGSWLSAYFILVTNAFMQHPVGHGFAADGSLVIADVWAYLLNEWAWVQVLHNQAAALVTGTFAVTAVGAFYALRGSDRDQARLYLRHGTAVGLVASVVVAFPTGDLQAKIVAKYQEPALAAMEGRFESGPIAEITLIGQPNVRERRLDNPIRIPGLLSFLAYGTFHSEVRGLNDFPPDQWPPNIELLYYSFHVMAGLGTIFIGLMGLAILQRLRGRLESSRGLLWILMLAFPFPFIANTAGWMTAELGRQPWLVYGLFLTSDGYSKIVSSGDVLFTLIGLCGLYFVLGLLYLFLVGREVAGGPHAHGSSGTPVPHHG